MEYFFDESGNTGDAALLDWGEQPTFVLAAVGKEEGDSHLAGRVDELRKKHHIQMAELKGSKLYNSKSGFVRDVVDFLIAEGYPVFVEVVDKRYHLTMMLTSYFLSSVSKSLRNMDEVRDSNIIADIIFEDFDDRVMEAYAEACRRRSAEATYEFMRVFALETRKQYGSVVDASKWSDEKDFARWANLSDIVQRGQASTEHFEELAEAGEPEDDLVSCFLPPPDENKSGKILAMLPHVTCFTYLYARLNAHAGDSDVRLVHDNQDQFDQLLQDYQEVLASNKFAMINQLNEEAELPWRDVIDWEFSDDHTIEFGDSKELIGIQIADLIAGFCRKYYDESIEKGDQLLDEDYEITAERLWKLGDSKGGQGINLVTSHRRAAATFAKGLANS